MLQKYAYIPSSSKTDKHHKRLNIGDKLNLPLCSFFCLQIFFAIHALKTNHILKYQRCVFGNKQQLFLSTKGMYTKQNKNVS